MRSLLDIKKEALMCAKRHNVSNEIKCMLENLKKEIDGDRNIYLYYKVECEKGLEYETITFSLSVSAFILSFVNLLDIFSRTAPDYSFVANACAGEIRGTLETIKNISWLGGGLSLVVFFLTIYTTVGSIKKMKKHENYKFISVILQEIDDHWNDYFKKEA